ncbi:unnamed protein product [Ilex paraguariensis]|uniref:Uncharacterized protein n=1 Tax=Ilex paraguariensis TaxID=185542 RepID=A0ABC8QPN4_9AQUA
MERPPKKKVTTEIFTSKSATGKLQARSDVGGSSVKIIETQPTTKTIVPISQGDSAVTNEAKGDNSWLGSAKGSKWGGTHCATSNVEEESAYAISDASTRGDAESATMSDADLAAKGGVDLAVKGDFAIKDVEVGRRRMAPDALWVIPATYWAEPS